MNFVSNLENNSILVIPSNLKNKILDYINENKLLINIKLMSFNELKKGLMFDYNNQTIYHVMNNYHVNYGVAVSHVNNLYHINNTNYNNDKLNNLLNIKNDLLDHNLLIKDRLFIDLLKNKSKLYVYGFSNINKLNNYLLELAKEYIDVEILNQDYNDYKHEVYNLKTIENEIIYVAEKISELVESGVPLNRIFIANYSNEYYFTIKKIFNLYKIPVFIKNETKLSDTAMFNYFINNLSDNIESLLYKLRLKYKIDEIKTNGTVFNKISNLINSYYWSNSYVNLKELMLEEAKQISIPSTHFEEEIVTTNIIDNIFNDDEYVFLIGFNMGSIPKSYKDEDYINDSIKTDTMETSIEKNVNSKEQYIKAIRNIKNLIITYKEVSFSSNHIVSPLVDKDYLINVDINNTYSLYSNDFNKLLYANKLDKLIKFNEKDDTLKELHNNYNIDYKSYDNKFTGIDLDSIKEVLEKKSFSYSNISTYYKCPFRFYMQTFFKLDKFNTTIDTFIGSLFHKVMEDCLKDETKDIDLVYDKFINENKHELEWTKSNDYYVEKLRSEIHFIINNIREQYKHSKHNISDEWHEKEVVFNSNEIDLNTKLPVIIKGIVDKCLVIDNDIVVIDYKTGTSDKIDRSVFEYGITIQLPIYLYLLKNVNKDYNIVGMYLQHILQGFIKKDEVKNKSVEDVRFNRLKLDGISLDDTTKLELFDDTYDNSDVIQGLKKKKDGTWSYQNRIMTSEDQENLYDTIKTLIENCINDVIDAKFDIKPIYIKYKADGCKYCKYRDICFKRESDTNIVVLSSKDGEEDE